MAVNRYIDLARDPHVRSLLLVGFLIRVPMFGVAVALTMHVVDALGRTWAQAGLVTTVSTLAIAVSGPWRGRLLDRLGLRRVVGVSVFVTAACWCVAPFVGYLPLMGLAALAGIFNVPSFTVLRQALVAATSEAQRRSVLSLDSVIVELAFMIGPLVGVLLATSLPTPWVIFGLEMTSAAMSLILWLLNPPITSSAEDTSDGAPGGGSSSGDARNVRENGLRQNNVRQNNGRQSSDRPGNGGRIPGQKHEPRDAPATGKRGNVSSGLFSPRFTAVCLAAGSAVLVLGGSDVAFIAGAREFGHPAAVGIVMTVWGLGSVFGGLIYGAMRRPPTVFVLLLGLGASTMALAAARGIVSLALLGLVAGVFCAPATTACYDLLTRVVDERRRGEATGWFGSAQTLGSSLGGPLAGAVVDVAGAHAAFMAVGAVGVLTALIGRVALSIRRSRHV